MRERTPGMLGWLPTSEHERFLHDEAVRYRRALIKIEGLDFRGHPSTEQTIACKALDDGEDRALRGNGGELT